jgi:hypothetical protein
VADTKGRSMIAMRNPKKCRECKALFVPRRPMQPTCDDIACKMLFALKVAAKAERKREKVAIAATYWKGMTEDEIAEMAESMVQE